MEIFGWKEFLFEIESVFFDVNNGGFNIII